MTILIPAYEPDQRLIDLLEALLISSSIPVVIVDDGSGPEYTEVFQMATRLGCKILTHDVNRGKGLALKTGFKYILDQRETEGVVTADCDGQHKPQDIIKIAAAVNEEKRSIILGSRQFSGKVPLRSIFGNTMTRRIFQLVTGISVFDTQTGLRGFPADTIETVLGIPGDRFEYEMNQLLESHDLGLELHEVEIATVYEEKKHSSHFRTVRDSIRVYLLILKFSASSLVSFIIDFSLLLLFNYLTGNLLLSVILARIISASSNFLINRALVFSSRKQSSKVKAFGRYAGLAIMILGMNYLLIHLLYNAIGIPLAVTKVLVEAALYVFSYWFQRRFVFAGQSSACPAKQKSIKT